MCYTPYTMTDKPNSNEALFHRQLTLIDPDLLARIDKLAAERGFGTTRSDIVREALRRMLYAEGDQLASLPQSQR